MILVAVVVTEIFKISLFLIEAFKLVPRILHYIQGQCSIGMNIECYYSVHPLNCESNISLISLFSFSFHWSHTCNWFRCLQEGFFGSCFTCRTGESRGFAFVRYKYADEAQKAIERLDGQSLRNLLLIIVDV